MDRSIPPAAALILNFIRATEVGTDARSGYDVIYANRQNKLIKPITEMSILQLQQGQATRWNGLVKSSASGGYQFMYKTLGGLIEELRLNVNQKFSPDLQDRLGWHLLKRRGYEKWSAGNLSDITFGKKLAQEWASFPVLKSTQGSKRRVGRGQSYYAGDGLNKALVSAARIETLLADAKHLMGTGTVVPPPPDLEKPPSLPPQKPTGSKAKALGFLGLLTGLIAAGIAIWSKM